MGKKGRKAEAVGVIDKITTGGMSRDAMLLRGGVVGHDQVIIVSL